MKNEKSFPGFSRRFQTTRWTMVLAARERRNSDGEEAMAVLCRVYWYPLYAFVRRSGHSAEDARDLTQAFFARLLEKEFLLGVDPEKGRFRRFLLMALKRFLANEWHRARAEKRGGGALHLPFDAREAEERYALEPVENLSPEMLYDRRWAFTLLERAMGRLREEFEASGRGAAFGYLKEFLADGERSSYAELAEKIGVKEGAARVAVHRLRRRFREVFREELAETVTAEKLEEELRHLRAILSS